MASINTFRVVPSWAARALSTASVVRKLNKAKKGELRFPLAKAIVQCKTRVIDIDLSSYFDNIKQDRLLVKVAKRVDDADVMHLLKIILKASGKQGVPQGGVLTPLTQRQTSNSSVS